MKESHTQAIIVTTSPIAATADMTFLSETFAASRAPDLDDAVDDPKAFVVVAPPRCCDVATVVWVAPGRPVTDPEATEMEEFEELEICWNPTAGAPLLEYEKTEMTFLRKVSPI